jgi:hypothetical protein
MQEAQKLFSPVGDIDTLGEMDEPGKANLVAFTSALDAQIEFASSAGRLHLMRKTASGTRLRASDQRKVLAFLR